MHHYPRYYVQYLQSGAICTQWFNVLEAAIKCAKSHENARIVDYFPNAREVDCCPYAEIKIDELVRR